MRAGTQNDTGLAPMTGRPGTATVLGMTMPHPPRRPRRARARARTIRYLAAIIPMMTVASACGGSGAGGGPTSSIEASTEAAGAATDDTAPPATGAAEEQLAFLVALLDDPVSVTDDEITARFDPTFLAQIPAPELRAAAAEATAGATGPWTVSASDLTGAGGTATVTSADGVSLTLDLALTPDGLIAGVAVTPGSAEDIAAAFAQPGSQAEVDAALDAVAPGVTYAVFDASDGACDPILHRNGDAVVPTGSAFKLWVLAALGRAVRDGEASWDETVPVTDGHRSSPDGEVYTRPNGTEVSLRELADLMISISDNTATDLLMARLGRPRVEAVLTEVGVSTAARNIPFLSTAELFKLKFVHPELGRRFLALDDPEQRRALLDGEVAAAPLPWLTDPGWTGDGEIDTPRQIDAIEWFATPRDLCLTFQDLDRLAATPGLEPVGQALEISSGIPFPDMQWDVVRFKGGSEPGVALFAYWLQGADGRRRVTVLSLTDPATSFPTDATVVPAARLLGLTATL